MIRRLILALVATAAPAAASDPPSWSEPIAPFRVVGSIYYVGTKGLAAYLIRTPTGAVLIDGTLEGNVPAIERSIVATGARLIDVKLLLNSHAHFDHAGGLARLKRDTGATVAALAPEVPALESGRPPSDTSYGLLAFPPVKVDRVLRDGETVRLGDVALTATWTPGHTPGCTTWSMPVRDGARVLRVVFPCSMTVAGNRLVGNRGYPGIVADFGRGLARLGAMRADIVLPAHPEMADVLQRHARQLAGRRDALVDPGQLARMVAVSRAAFAREFADQRAHPR